MAKNNGYNQQSNASDTVKQGASWGFIILLLIFFFPVGIGLMIVKLHKDKAHFTSNGKKTAIVGWVYIGFGILYMLMGLTGGLDTSAGSSVVSGVITMLIVCCGGGYAIVHHGNKYKKLGLVYDKYVPVISSTPDGSLDSIAEKLGETYDTSTENIQKLIDMGLLKDSYVDKSNRSIVSPLVATITRTNKYRLEPNQNTNATAQPAQSTPKVKTVKCPNCGGINTFTENADNICDFCGSPLS